MEEPWESQKSEWAGAGSCSPSGDHQLDRPWPLPCFQQPLGSVVLLWGSPEAAKPAKSFANNCVLGFDLGGKA